jgi:16S rRNA (uracil1498-N3)-methyltransferase
MATHRIHIDEALSADQADSMLITGDEAHHAIRVKRLAAGDRVELRDGRGGMALARITETLKSKRSGEWELRLAIDSRSVIAKRAPIIEVCSAAPKGDHLEDMIDQLSQLGASSWRLLECEHGVVEPRTGKVDRLKRRAAEAMKQCGRAWVLEIGDPISFADAIATSADTLVLAAEAAGAPIASIATTAISSRIRLLIGPEAGWSTEERAALETTQTRFLSLGPHVLRIETAAAASVAVVNAVLT